MNKYYIYILRCDDNSLYTGITTEIERRMYEHKEGKVKAAKYTINHHFKQLEIYFESKSRSEASKLEWHIKRLSKKEKEKLIKDKSLEILKGKLEISDYKLIK